MTNPLAAKIRGFCAQSVWEQGQALIDADAVQLDNREPELLEFEIAVPEAQEFNHVTLMLDVDDWGCDCTFRERVCAHVAAAAAFLNVNLPPDNNHNIVINPCSLANERVCRFDSQNGMLCLRPGFDLSFKFELSSIKNGPIPSEHMMGLLETLAKTCPVELDDRPIDILPAACGLCLRISDHANGILARLEQEPGITDVFNNGAVKRNGYLQAISHHDLPEKWFTVLRKGRVFRDHEIAPFSRRVLPDLSKKLPIFIDSSKLANETTVKPYIELHNTIDKNELVLSAHLIYGNPAIARIESGKIVLIQGHDIPVRIASHEAQLSKFLLETFSLEIDQSRRFSADEAIRVAQHLEQIQLHFTVKSEVIVSGNAYLAFLEIIPLTPQIRTEENEDYELLFVESEAPNNSSAPKSANAQLIMDAWEQGHRIVELEDGSLGQLPVDWLDQYGDRVTSLLASRSQRDSQSKPMAHELWDLAEICRSLNHPSPFGADRLASILADFTEVPTTALPEDLTAVLRDYQRRGVDWLSFLREAHFGALLADDMGLGKTIQALCTVLDHGKTLVVAPTSVIHNWANEIRRFRPALRAHLYHGSNRQLPKDSQVVLTTYAILRIDQSSLAAIHWDCVILDEAQAIKNSRSKVAQAAFSLSARFRMVLTGTPIENRLEDLWSQFHFLNRGLLGGRKHFLRKYVNSGESSEIRNAGSEALKRRIKPFILRRTKREVELELPSRTEVVLHSELNPDERKIYNSIRFATQEQLVSALDQKLNVMAMLEALLRLRQCACHPALLPGYGHYLDRSSSKIQLLIETLKETLSEGHRSLIYSQWTSFLDLVEHDLKHQNIGFVRLDGQTRNRQAVIDEFTHDSGPPVMLISLKAGGTGINLTAADHVFLMDPWWNPAVEDQAADRVHRIGQTRPVLIHRLVSQHTVEDRILALQAKKRDLAESTVGASDPAQSLSRDDLLLLLDA